MSVDGTILKLLDGWRYVTWPVLTLTQFLHSHINISIHQLNFIALFPG